MLLVYLVSAFIFSVNANSVTMWMCLERCNSTSSEIHQHLQQIEDHVQIFSGISFEMFNLGPNSELVLNNFTDVLTTLKRLKLQTSAMISSFPYPPDFIIWMRQLFNNPEPFFAEAVSRAKQFGFDGFNVDFEPTTGVEKADATAYAEFLNKFADVLHAQGLTLSVDVASWSVLWDWPLLSSTRADKIMVMATYAGDPATWKRAFDQAVSQIDPKKLGIGLQTVNPNTNQPLSDDELQFRFQNIIAGKAAEVDIWVAPLADNWWPFLENFTKQ